MAHTEATTCLNPPSWLPGSGEWKTLDSSQTYYLQVTSSTDEGLYGDGVCGICAHGTEIRSVTGGHNSKVYEVARENVGHRGVITTPPRIEMVVRHSLEFEGLLKTDVENNKEVIESNIAVTLGVTANDVTITSISLVTSRRRLLSTETVLVFKISSEPSYDGYCDGSHLMVNDFEYQFKTGSGDSEEIDDCAALFDAVAPGLPCK